MSGFNPQPCDKSQSEVTSLSTEYPLDASSPTGDITLSIEGGEEGQILATDADGNPEWIDAGAATGEVSSVTGVGIIDASPTQGDVDVSITDGTPGQIIKADPSGDAAWSSSYVNTVFGVGVVDATPNDLDVNVSITPGSTDQVLTTDSGGSVVWADIPNPQLSGVAPLDVNSDGSGGLQVEILPGTDDGQVIRTESGGTVVDWFDPRLDFVDVVTGNELRPVADKLLWVGGTTQPVNMAIDDIWFAEDEESPSP